MQPDGRRIRPSFCDEANNERNRGTRMEMLDGGSIDYSAVSVFTLSRLAIPR